MPHDVSKGLNVLARGLRPYVAARLKQAGDIRDPRLSSDIEAWDAQALLLFMWDYWNDLFRSDLTFVERSLISELREFRNRWAHQSRLSDGDVYRILDDIERLLRAIHSDEAEQAATLRREALNQLWNAEVRDRQESRLFSQLWPYILCGASAVALDAAIISFGQAPWSWLLAMLVFLAMMRIAWRQSIRETLHRPGPHECNSCGCIIYTVDCPYCQAAKSDPAAEAAEILLPLSRSWKNFRLPRTTSSGNRESASEVAQQ